MQEDNIQGALGTEPIKPADAAKNIKEAKVLKMNPDEYSKGAAHVRRVMAKETEPKIAPRPVAKRMLASKQHANAIKPELGIFDSVSRYIEFAGNKIKGQDIGRDISELAYKKAIGKELTGEEKFKLIKLNGQLAKLNHSEEYNYNFWESLPAEVVSSGLDMVEGIWDNKELVGLGVAGGATSFGTIGGLTGAAPGLAIGALTGAGVGLAYGTGAAMVRDTYIQSTGQVYNDLEYVMKDNGLTEDERRKISLGAGTLMAGVAVVPFSKILQKVPFFKKIISPRKVVQYMLKNPQGGGLKKALLEIGESAAIEGGEEVAQEAIQIWANKVAETWDGKETNLGEALTTAWNSEEVMRLAKAGTVGAAAGGAFNVAGRTVTAPLNAATNRLSQETLRREGGTPDAGIEVDPTEGQQFDDQGSLIEAPIIEAEVQKGVKSLRLAQVVRQVTDMTKGTEFKKLLPEDQKEMLGEMFDTVGLGEVYIDREDLNAWVGQDETRLEAVTKILTDDMVQDAELNIPVKISTVDLMELSENDSSLVLKAKVDPDGVSAEQYKNRVQEFRKDQAKLKAELDKEAKAKKAPVENDLPVETDAVIRLEDEAKSVVEENGRETDPEKESRIQMVSEFTSGAKLGEGQSSAMDPNLLPDRLRNRFQDDQVLKERNAFAEGGQDPKLIAELHGYDSVEQFLDDLSTTPSAEQSLTESLARTQGRIEVETLSDNAIDNSKLVKTYQKDINQSLKDARKLSKEKGLNRGVPIKKNLHNQANERLRRRRIGNLKLNEAEAGRQKSQVKFDSELESNNFGNAFNEKLRQTKAEIMSLETRKLVAKVNRDVKFIAGLSSIEVNQEMKNAGKLYTEAVQDLLVRYGFYPNSEAKPGAYDRFAKKMLNEGKGDFTMDTEVKQWLGQPESYENMNYDQFKYVVDKVRTIVTQARQRETFLADPTTDDGPSVTVDMIAEELEALAKQHPAYDESKSEESQGVTSAARRLSDNLNTIESLAVNRQMLVQQLDEQRLGGKWAERIDQPIEEGVKAEVRLQGEINKRYNKAVKKYFGSIGKFKAYARTKVFVPEFANAPSLSKGRLTKLDLLSILMNMGTETNVKYVENFGFSKETAFKVLKRELGENDFDFVQDFIWGTYKWLKPKLAEVHLKTEGVELDFIEPQGFEAFGKEYEGGYFPVQLREDLSYRNQLERIMDYTKDTVSAMKAWHPAYEGVVRRNHTKRRTGSRNILDIEVDISRGFDEHVHDIAMRVPVRDTMQLLNNKRVAKSIRSVLGTSKYNTLVNSIAGLTNSASIEERLLYKDLSQKIQSITSYLEGGQILTWIAGSPSTFIINNLAVREMSQKLGNKVFSKHVSKVVLRAFNPAAPGSMKDMFELAREVDPSILSYREGLDDFQQRTIKRSKLPEKRVLNFVGWHKLRNTQEAMNDFMVSTLLGGQDTFFKTIMVNVSYSAFKNGDAPGFPVSKLATMTDAEIDKKARQFANQMVQSTTMRGKDADKAAIQKLPMTKIMTRIWNEMRNGLNNRIGDIRSIGYNTKAARKAVSEGDFLGANIAFQDSGGKFASMILWSAFGLALINISRGLAPFSTGEEQEELVDTTLAEQISQFPEWMVEKTTTPGGLFDLANEMFISNMPLLRDVVYGTQTGRGTSFPLLVALDTIGESTVITYDALAYYKDEMDFVETLEMLGDNPQDIKTLFTSLGILSGGLPVNALYKWGSIFTEAPEVLTPLQVFVEKSNSFLQAHDDTKDMTPEQMFARLKKKREGKLTETQTMVDRVKDVRAKVMPTAQMRDPLNDIGYEIIKHAESNGRWNASPGTSGAFGHFQFVAGTWRNIINTAEGKAAGLTMADRLSRNPKYQKIGMKILTKMNAKALQNKGVPVNIETIYFAHHFGIKHAEAVYLSPDSKKLPRDLLSSAVLRANPQLQREGVKTTGDMKQYIRRALQRGVRSYERRTGVRLTRN